MRNRLISFKGESVSKMYTYVNVGILYPCNICIQDLTAVTDTCVHDRRLLWCDVLGLEIHLAHTYDGVERLYASLSTHS